MSWLNKLKSGLSKTSSGITRGIGDIFTKRKLDEQMLEELEELLITADIGASLAIELVEKFSKNRFDKEVDEQEVKEFLANEISQIIEPSVQELKIDKLANPHVIIMVGVNGNGKTTTIGKLASHFKAQGNSVMLAAADTFRAAAVEQLKEWGERTNCEVISSIDGADSASVAYKAYEKAKANNIDVLMIDTAGRLNNKSALMDELKKIIRVITKLDENAPHTILQVLDATTGQNALSQIESFKESAGVNGLIISKLDGTAKAGVVVSIAKQYETPIYAIGVGEAVEDLQSFNAKDFARSLVGIG